MFSEPVEAEMLSALTWRARLPLLPPFYYCEKKKGKKTQVAHLCPTPLTLPGSEEKWGRGAQEDSQEVARPFDPNLCSVLHSPVHVGILLVFHQ